MDIIQLVIIKHVYFESQHATIFQINWTDHSVRVHVIDNVPEWDKNIVDGYNYMYEYGFNPDNYPSTIHSDVYSMSRIFWELLLDNTRIIQRPNLHALLGFLVEDPLHQLSKNRTTSPGPNVDIDDVDIDDVETFQELVLTCMHDC